MPTEGGGAGSFAGTAYRIQILVFVVIALVFTLGTWGNGFVVTLFVAGLCALLATLVVSACMNVVRHILEI